MHATGFPIAMPEEAVLPLGVTLWDSKLICLRRVHDTADATLILGLLILNFADVKDAEPTNDRKSHFLGTGIIDSCC